MLSKSLTTVLVAAVLVIGGLVAIQVWPIEEPVELVAASTDPSLPLGNGPGEWEIVGHSETSAITLEEAAEDYLRAWQAAGWTANLGLDQGDGYEVATLAAWRGNCSAGANMVLDPGRLFVAVTVRCIGGTE
jgi:hypothetical protein